MASVRFLRDAQHRIIEVVLLDGSMQLHETVVAARCGNIYQISEYNDGPNNTIDLVFPPESPFRGTVVGLDKTLINLNPDIVHSTAPAANQGGCKSC